MEFGKPADQIAGVLDGDAGATFSTVDAACPVAVDEGFESGGRVTAVVCVFQGHVAAACDIAKEAVEGNLMSVAWVVLVHGEGGYCVGDLVADCVGDIAQRADALAVDSVLFFRELLLVGTPCRHVMG